MDLYLKKSTANNVSITGDDGQPNVKLSGTGWTQVAVKDAIGNVQFCTQCAALITAGSITVRLGSATGTVMTATNMSSIQNGSVFDLNADGIADKAQALDSATTTDIDDGDSPYTVLSTDTMVRCDVTTNVIGCTLPAGTDSQIFQFLDVSSNAGTNNITLTPDGAETINGGATYVINVDDGGVTLMYNEADTDWKVISAAGGALPAAVALNTAHRTADGSSHTFIDQDVTSGSTPNFDVTNFTGSAAGIDSDATAHASSDGSSHTYIDQDVTSGATPNFDVTNMTGSAAGLDSNVNDNVVDAVIAVADVGAGGANTSLESSVQTLAAGVLSKTAVFKIVASDTQYAGIEDQNGNVTFSVATKGSILASGSGWAIVKTDGSGEFDCTVTNAVDETVWFSICSVDGGADALANGVVIRGCIPDDATWS